MVLLIKFGKKEHLEQLKNGIVHFSPIELFQEDPTDFRGDKMEGKHYIDTSKPFLINGTDISMYIKEAVVSYELNCRYVLSQPLYYPIIIVTWFLGANMPQTMILLLK